MKGLHKCAIFDSMDINWLGRSCFRIRGRQATVVTDPYSAEFGEIPGKPTARIVTVSHQHPGHSNVAAVGDDPRTVGGPGEYEISGVLIVGVGTFHDDQHGAERGKNTVYLMDIDEVSLCHLGDLGHPLGAEHMEELGSVDVLFVPVGGGSTINGSGAAAVVRQLEPRLVVPMHYRTGAGGSGLAPVDDFLKEMGLKDVELQSKLTVTRTNLPLTTQVVVLDC